MINLPAELVTILSGPHTTAQLLTIELETDLHLTNAGAHIHYGGIEYRAGFWQAKASITQQSSPKIGELNLDLNTVDSAITALFFASNWLNAPVTISKVWFNDSNQILFKSVIWRGLLNSKSGEESEKKATSVPETKAELISKAIKTILLITVSKSNAKNKNSGSGSKCYGFG